ncbi:hypothetical protein [Escherichia coli]|uniref:hypothetical protein n=1 Tax=Escherichia coli TaxID=562 RepID=UPI00388DD480
MTEQRPELRTPGSTVAAAERIVAWLKTALQGKTLTGLTWWSVTSASSTARRKSNAICPVAPAVSGSCPACPGYQPARRAVRSGYLGGLHHGDGFVGVLPRRAL